ncbi:MAG: hypothetical protein JO368_11230, partial [Acidimicrobiales bacterium]|nr:hypothetical protein [Acidimicrobiales bacterium]
AGLTVTTHDYTTTAVGVYHWSASYPGDHDNVAPASSVCTEAVTISAAPTPTATPTPTSTTTTTTTTTTAAGVSAEAASNPTIASPSTGADVPFAAGGFLLVSGLGFLGLGASRRRRSNRDGN